MLSTGRSEAVRSGEEAVLAVGMSQTERLRALHRIQRVPYVRFDPVEWLGADQLDDIFFTLLPTGESTISAAETAELATIFGEDGELPARRLS